MQSKANVASSFALSRDHATQDQRRIEPPRGEHIEAAPVHMLVIQQVSSCSSLVSKRRSFRRHLSVNK